MISELLELPAFLFAPVHLPFEVVVISDAATIVRTNQPTIDVTRQNYLHAKKMVLAAEGVPLPVNSFLMAANFVGGSVFQTVREFLHVVAVLAMQGGYQRAGQKRVD